MAVNGEIELSWADGQHKFNVAKLKCVLELEEKCGVGFAEIYQRLVQGKWYFNDIRETLRLGLIGGGLPPDRALALINRYVDGEPMAQNVLPAQAVIMAALVGVQGDNPEKKTEADRAKENRSSPTVDMSDPSSTDSVPPSDSIPAN
jgi:hypothetical protein